MSGFCSNCGAVVNAPFCSSCGTPRVAESPQVATQNAMTSFTQPIAAPGLAPPIPINPNAPGARFIGQWNWGAALLTPYWLMTHRNAPMGIVILIVGLIPFVNICSLVALVYYGINGNRVAVLSGRFTSESQFVAVQNAWRNWALGITAFMIVSVVVANVALVFLGANTAH